MSSDKKVLQFAIAEQVKSLELVKVEIEHPVTKAPLGISVTFLGRYTPAFREAQRKIAAAKRSTDGEIDQETVAEGMVGFIASWEGVKDTTGADVACTRENVRALLLNPATGWIVEQLTIAFTDRARFFAPSTAS